MEEVARLPTLAATRKLGKRLAQSLKAGDVLALVGDLGAGKTTLVQAIARALDVADPGEVVSPTYTLVNEHPTARGALIHIDLYRLTDAESAVALGLVEQLHRRDAIVLVEWADRFSELIPAHATWVTLR
ncbi:MAG TPA: tRNA (adenosine(37)-N6)-threonylcarbamoyltransferase complex ATPase subunit type 1 TsaE, partial [Myxococcota bacterium]|nr:tRNA (adenosine(37)-N6)-threonylcarbamoyltransferase complex ATPase subunit type 1 TsaE [Myxococcota bacterium]